MNNDKMHANIIFINNLENGHTATVNVVKFNKNGRQLASGSDDHKIIIWEKKDKPIFGTED
jgi:WD40 repeat protein